MHQRHWQKITQEHNAEIERLKHDLDRYMTIATNEVNESERLRAGIIKLRDASILPQGNKGPLWYLLDAIVNEQTVADDPRMLEERGWPKDRC